jgi:hypothetical protein
MKTIYSLGCSFMSTDSRYDLPSFVDMFANKRNLRHVNLARSGATNYAIRLQIDLALQEQADYVIVGATSSDRIDLVDETLPWRSPLELQFIKYTNYNCVAEKYVNNESAYIFSDTLNNLLEDRHHLVGKEKREALKQYVAQLHHNTLQQYKDACIIRDGLRLLEDSGKPYLFIPGPLFYMDWSKFNAWTSKDQPWDMPFGINNYTVNHNPPEAHEYFSNELAKQVDWN